jgi:hypothetical protein
MKRKKRYRVRFPDWAKLNKIQFRLLTKVTDQVDSSNLRLLYIGNLLQKFVQFHAAILITLFALAT